MYKLRYYQVELSLKALKILNKYKIVYIAAMVRVGKTLTALNTAKLYGAKNVLFLTKKKAIQSIRDDYNNFGYLSYYKITIINNESLHKIEGVFDLIIMDEAHRFGNFPKPNKYAKDFKKRFSKIPQIYLSGTPHPESYSQVYHQFWVSDYSPFSEFKNFYKWAKVYVNVVQKNFGYAKVNDYSNANKNLINQVIKPYMITFTQKEAGFESEVKENVLHVEMKKSTYDLANILKSDKVYEGVNDVVLTDTSVKLQQKLHQIYSGTVILESGKAIVFDYTKADYIKRYFEGKKIAIFYKFQAEYKALKEVFKHNITNDLEEFNTTNKNIALQIVSGREGVSLKNADCLVYYNIDFSSVSYWQSRDRMTTKERLVNSVYWVFSKNGIEDKIYKTVLKKKNFTNSVFKREMI